MVWPGASVLSAIKLREEEAVLSLPLLALHIHTNTHTQTHTQTHTYTSYTHRHTYKSHIHRHTGIYTSHTQTPIHTYTDTHRHIQITHRQTQTDTQNHSQVFCKFIFSLFLEELTS